MDSEKGLPSYEDNHFDLACVDPPYGVNYKKWDIKPKKKYFNELFRISKNQIIWGLQYYIEQLKSTECILCWDKENGETRTHFGEFAWTSFNGKSKTFKFFWWSNMMNKKEKPIIHPTQKPIALYAWLLKNYAKKGDLILDTHLGSGSSRIAAYKLGFDFTGYEIDKDYYEDAEKRFQKEINGIQEVGKEKHIQKSIWS
jgi:site-specific DNA-methyltransferase (adenine-specific)